MARAMNCEIDHIALAHFIETVERIEDSYGKKWDGNRVLEAKAGEIFSLRVCKKHSLWRFKGCKTTQLEPIIEGYNNLIHPSDKDQMVQWENTAKRTEEMLGRFAITGAL